MTLEEGREAQPSFKALATLQATAPE